MTGSRTPPHERFPGAFRLRKRREFLRVQRCGRRRVAPHFVVIIHHGETDIPRIGITTSKKVGNAPVRNRVRRLVREFFRRHRTMIEAANIVIIARTGAAALSYHDACWELRDALRIPANRTT